MNRITTTEQASIYRLIPLHELRENDILWNSYVEMRDIQEDLNGEGNDPDAIVNEQEAAELQLSSALRQTFFNSVEQGFNFRTDLRFALVDMRNAEVVGETVIYPPQGENDLPWSNSMIHPDLRGKRLGSVMLARVLEQAQVEFADMDAPMMETTIRAENEASWRRFQRLSEEGLAKYEGEITGRTIDGETRKSHRYTIPLTHQGKPINFMTALVEKKEDALERRLDDAVA